MNDPLLACGFERFPDLRRDGERLIDRDRATGDPLREILAVDEFHHERGDATALFELCQIALETRSSIVIGGDTLMDTVVAGRR